MSFGVIMDNGLPAMSFSPGDDLLTNVILSLEIGLGDFFADPGFGLRKRQRMKNTDGTARLIRGDIQSALQWLLDTKRATAIEITMERDTLYNKNRLMARVSATGAQGNKVSYEKFMEVV